jgi:hypothetical protein
MTEIESKIVFEGIHCWPDAPVSVPFLREPHRHMFVVRARKAVRHDDRDVEFIEFGWTIHAKIAAMYPAFGVSAFGRPETPRDLGTTSCEQLARRLVEEFDLESCSVHEDDENGAIVYREAHPE